MAMQNSVLGKGSDFYEEITDACKPCSSRGKRLQADQYCKDCVEYLCKECATYHKVLTATQKHILITSEEAEKFKPMCKPCSGRGKKLQADQYCKDCKEYLCKECATYHKVLTATQKHILITNEEAEKETVTLCSAKIISSSSAGVPAKKAPKASSPSAGDPPKSGQIQPGSRVWVKEFYGCHGTVEHYDSSRGRWKVNWDAGFPGYCPAANLRIL